jgi:hypothetical protein
MLDAAGAKALGAGLLLRSLVTQCSKGLGMPWARNRMARGLRRSVPGRFGRTAGSRWMRTSAGAVVCWQSASRAAGGLPDPVAVTRLRLSPSPRPFPTVSVSTIEDFSRSARQYATDHTGGLPPGLQTGIALVSCLVRESGSGRFGRGLRQGSSSNSPSWRGRLPPLPGGCRGRFRAHAVSWGHPRATPAAQADALF